MEKILIIDDEVEIIELLDRFLRIEGFKTEKALNGTEALQKMQEGLFNIVLCDISLPDIKGTELISELKKYNPLTNIIMITGYSSMDNVVTCLGGGAVDYFTKPFRNIDILIDAIKQINNKIMRWKHSVSMINKNR